MPATISLMGLYNADITLLNPLKDVVPGGLGEAAVTRLMVECSELEIIYPNPSLFKFVLSAWCKTRATIWRKLYDTTNFSYDPIHNYDRTEIETITRKNNQIGNTSSNSNNSIEESASMSNSNSKTESQDIDETGSESTSENRYGFNSANSSVPVSTISHTRNLATDTNISVSDSQSGESEATTTASGTNNENRSQSENEDISRTLRNYGNIGVTTTQQMIEQQRESVKYDIVEDIINDFKARFCILVY